MKTYFWKKNRHSPIETRGEVDEGGWRILEVLPLLITIFISIFGLIAIILLCFGALSTALVCIVALPIATAVSWYAAMRMKLRLPGTVKERRIGMVAIVALVSLWSFFNMHYSSEDVYINRDPGSYNVTARWIMDNDNLVIYGSHVFGKAPSIASDTAGFGHVASDGDGRIYAQAPHLFPALIGLVGRAFGPEAMMKANAIIGGLALLMVYGFIRMFVRPRWAILATALFSICLPMFYFSRDTYTEPLTILLVFGALSCLVAARTMRNKLLWGIVGIVAASSTLARIDAFLLLAGFIGSIFVLALLDKRITKGEILSFLAGAALTAFVGWWDVSTLSRRYFIDLRFEFTAQVGLIVVALLFGLAALYMERRKGILGKFFKANGTRVAKWLLVAAVIFVAFLLSRPAWLVSHEAGNPYSRPYIASLQAKDGEEIDAHRNYAEYSLYWVIWYVGPMVALLGFVGFMLCLKSVFDKNGIDLAPLLLVFGAMAVLYFLLPKITADQIWAIRRFLPVVIPAIFFFVAVALQWMYGFISNRKHRAVASVVLSILLAGPIAFISAPFAMSKEYAGQLAQIEKVCISLPKNSAVLLVGQNGINMTQTIRAYCRVPAERLPQPTQESLSDVAKTARSRGYTPIVFVIGYEMGFISKDKKDFTDMGAVKYQEMERELTRPPHRVEEFARNILLAELTNDGRAQPIVNRSN